MFDPFSQVCAPTHFSFPAGGSQGGSVGAYDGDDDVSKTASEYASARVARYRGIVDIRRKGLVGV